MIETTTFSIFARRPAAPASSTPAIHAEPSSEVHSGLPVRPSDDDLPHPPNAVNTRGEPDQPSLLPDAAETIVEPEIEDDGAASPPFWSGQLGDVMLPADQLGLAHRGVITLHVSLPNQPAARLGSGKTGLYRPEAPAEAAEPETGLATGTCILTLRGEMAVETLAPGDVALALRGPALLPIRWIGRASVAKPGVLIKAGALGRDMPRRPLRLAADHPVFVQPTPVPARSLVNGSTIQAVALDDAVLFQVDVGASEVLLAEGVPLSSDRRTAP